MALLKNEGIEMTLRELIVEIKKLHLVEQYRLKEFFIHSIASLMILLIYICVGFIF